ncbi:MAG: PAS domain S-box protein [Actinobacteria bacterium]|nr:MAG: PAS domain S-box protein [Actinomycetota bacterium]
MWRSHSFRSALTRRLLLAALLPLVVVGVVSVIFVRGLLAEQIARSNDLNARALVAQIGQSLEVPKAVAAPYLSQSYQEVLATEDPAAHWRDLIDRLPEVESILLLDDAGIVRAAALESSTGMKGADFIGLDRSRDVSVAEANATGEAVWSNVYRSPITGEASLSYVVPLREGAIVVNVMLARMLDFTALDDSTVLPIVIDGNGVPISYPDEEVITQRLNMRSIGIVDDVLSGTPEAQGRYSWQGEEYLGIARRIGQVGWVALATQPWEQVQRAIFGTQYIVTLLLVLAAVFALALAAALSQRLAEPISELARHADRVAHGEYGEASADYQQIELSKLGSALNDMTSAVKRREHDLATSARQYRYLIESLRAVPWEYDMDSDCFVYVGPQAERLFGYPPGTWTTLDSWVQSLHPDDRDGAVTACMTATSLGLDHNLEYRAIRPDGEIVWIEDVVSVHADESGSIRLVGVMIDISESKEAASLRVAAEAAEAASHAKSSFLANMSHELRTPLNSILGFGNIMLSRLAGPINDEQERQLGMIVRSGNHLLALVNDVLDLEKIEAGAMPIEADEFDVAELVRSAAEIMTPMAKSQGLALDVRVPDGGLMVSTDEDRVQQVLLNLFSNAVKFTEAGGVTISLDSVDNQARVTVEDTGIGIPKGRLEEVFDEFKSMGRPGDNPLGGTGLGLPISRRLARLLGGDVTLSSTKGTGSTFVFTFTLTAPRSDDDGDPIASER